MIHLFSTNFKKIDKNTFLKDLQGNIIILDYKNQESKLIEENNNNNIETTKYINLFSKYPDLILFTFIITKNSYKKHYIF